MAENSDRSYRWVLPLLVGIFCGGLGGSVFTWYMNRPRPTVLTYRVATTTLSAPEAVGLIPQLKVLIGGLPIQALYSHNIELLPRQGPFVDQADVAFGFSSPVRVYGIHEESPSDLHHIACTGFSPLLKNDLPLPDPAIEISSVQCTIRPIFFQGNGTRPFRVTVATDKSDVPQVLAAAKNLDLVAADQFSPKEQEPPRWLLILIIVVSVAGSVSIVDTLVSSVRSKREWNREFDERFQRYLIDRLPKQ